MTDRRFTDREVALILRRSVELEKALSSDESRTARGLSLTDLKEIATEAGISPEVIGRAVAELEGRKGLEPMSLLGPPTFNRDVRAVPEALPPDALAELIRIVDREVDAQGTVQEALGSVRWNSKGKFVSTQVSLEPSSNETLIRVEERFTDQVRGVIHGVPAAYGLILGLPILLEALNLGLPLALVLSLTAAALGWTLGDLAWKALAKRSRSRVRALAESLGQTASKLLPRRAPEGEPGHSGDERQRAPELGPGESG